MRGLQLTRYLSGVVCAAVVFTAACGRQQRGPNTPPVIDSIDVESNPVDPGSTISVRVRALDPDQGGGPSKGLAEGMEASWSVSGSDWTVEGNGAEASVTAPETYEKRATLRVRVTDRRGASTASERTLRTGTNKYPRGVELQASKNPLPPGGTADLSVTAEDPRGDELSFAWRVSEGWSLDSSSGESVRVTAPDAKDEIAFVEVSVSDGHGAEVRRSMRIRTLRNAPPSIASVSASPIQVEPGGKTTLRVDASDPDGDDLSYSWRAPGGWKLEGSGAEVTAHAPDSYGEQASIEVEVSDGHGALVAGRTVVSTGSNSGPVVHGLSVSPRRLARGGTASAEVSASDPDGDSLSYKWSTAGKKWSVKGNGAKATVTAPSLPGTTSRVIVEVSDGSGQTVRAAAYVSTAANRPPTVADVVASPAFVDPGKKAALEVRASDPDGDSLSYSWKVPKGWSVKGSGSKVDLVAPGDRGRRAVVRTVVTDGHGGRATGTVTVSTETNRAPSIASVTATPSIVGRSGTSTLRVQATDANGDPLGYNWSVPKGWSKKGSGKSVVAQAPNAFGERGRFTVEVTDGKGGKTTGAVVVNTTRNRPPTISDLSAGKKLLKPGGKAALIVRAVDPEGDPLSYSWNTPKNWSVKGSGASVKAVAPKTYGVSAKVRVVVSDGNHSTSESVTLSTVANNPPIAGQLSVSPNPVLQNAEATAKAKASDPDGHALSYNWSTADQDWTIQGSGDSVGVRAPNKGNASTKLTVVVTDGHGGQAKMSLTVKTKACKKKQMENCDGKAKNGCETDVTTVSDHCGACGRSCSKNKPYCNSSKCSSVPTSCRDIKEAGISKSGTYDIDPDGPTNNSYSKISVRCEMKTKGGGWTVIKPCLARKKLNGKLVEVDGANDGFNRCRPWSRDGNGDHYFHYTFQFPGGFSEFLLHNYELRANASGWNDASELNNNPHKKWSANNVQDVSFGTPANKGPTTSFARLTSVNCESCTKSWPKNDKPYSVGKTVTSFRIGWGEGGGQNEGWYPWWSGEIWLR